MTEKVYSLEELRGIILPIIHKYNAQSAILFGSYARDEADYESDIDVMIIGGESFVPSDVFCIADDLFKTARKPVDVYEKREIDDGSTFYQTIMDEGIELR